MRCSRIATPTLFVLLTCFSQAYGQDDIDSIATQIEQAQSKEIASITDSNAKTETTDLDSLTLDALMKHLNVPGVSIATIKDFKLHWVKAYGIADKKAGLAVNSNTLFQAASISKPVNAMAILKAAQDEKFSIDQDVNTVLKSWKIPSDGFLENQHVSARMLASHVSGLGDGFGFPGYKPLTPIPNLIQILDGQEPSTQGPVRLVRPPMTAFQYSGGGVTVLQLLLTDVFDQPYPEILDQVVLRPIGMTNSFFEQPLSDEHDKNAARAHSFSGRVMRQKWKVHPELAAAGLWTTPTDLAKFAIEVQKSLRGEANNVLSQSMVKEMLSPVGVGNYAVGFSMSKQGQGWYFSHGGGNWGFRCLLHAHKVKGYGFVIMTNSIGGSLLIGELKKRIERAYGYDALNSSS
jgi:CubicO group peptidase (beta-lactamase class C family)